MRYHIEFKGHELKTITSDGIDSDRYIIPFILTKRKVPPFMDEISEHRIKVEISGRLLATEGVWHCEQPEIPKVIFAHTFEYIKSLITKNMLSGDLYFRLDKTRLSQSPIDPKKVREINDYNFDFEVDDPTKPIGFR